MESRDELLLRHELRNALTEIIPTDIWPDSHVSQTMPEIIGRRLKLATWFSKSLLGGHSRFDCYMYITKFVLKVHHSSRMVSRQLQSSVRALCFFWLGLLPLNLLFYYHMDGDKQIDSNNGQAGRQIVLLLARTPIIT
jgi:hypothetical protein